MQTNKESIIEMWEGRWEERWKTHNVGRVGSEGGGGGGGG